MLSPWAIVTVPGAGDAPLLDSFPLEYRQAFSP